MIVLLCLALAQDALQPAKIPLADASRQGASFSPDGAWVCYFEDTVKSDKFSKSSRHAALFRATLDGKAEKVVDVGNGGGEIRWHPDGKTFAVVRAVADTNGDGKIDSRDGDSLWMDGKDVIPPGKKKISFYGFLSDGKMVVGYRDAWELPAKIVIRDAEGKETDLVEAQGLVLIDDRTALIRSIRRDMDEHGHGHERVTWTFFAFETKSKGGPLKGDVLGLPVLGRECIAYARVVDPETRKTVIVLCGRDGKGAVELTKGDETMIPEFETGTGVFCSVIKGAGSEFVHLSVGGERKSLYLSGPKARSPRRSLDGTRIVFSVERDALADLYVSPVAFADAKPIAEAVAGARAREDWGALKADAAALPKEQAIPKLEEALKTFAAHPEIVKEIEGVLQELKK